MSTFLWLALAGTLAGSLPTPLTTAQTTAPTAGRLRYETTQRVDKDRVKITMLDPNGQEIKTDGPGSTVELPSSMSAVRTLVFSGHYAMEEQPQHMQLAGGNINMLPSKNPVATTRTTAAVDTEAQYFDFVAGTVTTVATIGGSVYALPPHAAPTPPTGWQDLPQTKKIAGYLCHKATVPFRRETYTLWVTTELPFTYSPVRELTPVRGVVLALSSDQEEYLATKLTAEPVAEAAVRPSPQAQPITEAALHELRAKAQADKRQQVLEQFASPATH